MVELILRKLSEGATETDLLEAYPKLTRQDIRAALAYAARTVSHEEIIAQINGYHPSLIAVRSTGKNMILQVRNRGAITLPKNIREKYGIKAGDAFCLVDLDGVFALTPMAPIVPELEREIEQARLEAGLSIDDLLQSLREQRQRYSQEKYGDINNPGNKASS